MLKSRWLLLQSGPGGYAYNMALDEALLEAMPRLGAPALRFYAWIEPAASFGYFQHFAEIERLTTLRPLVRRPTGGGLVPHDADWTYSLVFPPVHDWYLLAAAESYRRVHELLRAAFARLGIETQLAPQAVKTRPGQCFAGYELSDLLRNGVKLAGAAQRRRRDGLLIQGSIQPPSDAPARSAFEQALCDATTEVCHADLVRFEPDAALQRRTAELARRKYSQQSYTRMR